MILVGIGHRDGVGKSTFANLLRKHLGGHGVEIHPFADEVKRVCVDLFRPLGLKGAAYYESFPQEKDQPLPCGKTPRDIWKAVGDGMRDIWGDVWWERNKSLLGVNRSLAVIIPDVRKMNEVEYITRQGGWMIEVDNPRVPSLPGKSFSELGDYQGWKRRIENSGNLHELAAKAKKLAAEILSSLNS